LVSIIVPVYNGASFVQDAVRSALTQTYPSVEVVVINDGSTDASGEVAEELRRQDSRVRVVHQENKGLSAARNAGIAHAHGEYINFLDADDWLLPTKLDLQVEALESNPSRGIVYSDYVKWFDGTEFPVRRGLPPIPFSELFVYRNWFAPMVPLLRSELVAVVGGFDTGLRASEDWDYWYRCAQRTEFGYVPGVVAVYRLHGAQMTKDRSRMTNAQLQYAAKHFAHDRRRYRSNMTFHHLDQARHAWGTRQYLRCATRLVRFALSANSVREAKFVWTTAR
jgi:glycosyltransferase involved in cell wall biosynthesis